MRAILIALLLVPLVTAHNEAGGDPEGTHGDPDLPPDAPFEVPVGERPCPFGVNATWREEQVIEGVPIRESRACLADDPRAVAAFVKGTNNVPRALLDDIGLSPDAVIKDNDRDGDGDPDDITITLEVIELNGWHVEGDALAGSGYSIAPGVQPGFWVFAPKTQRFHGGPVEEFWRMPSPPIRVEEGDTVTVRLENTHYLPHTVHLHGVDHAFEVDGEGNDGVPHVSENPTMPGEVKEYTFQARQPGTMFYHCHVQPQVHVLMGLNGPFIVEEARPNNTVQTINVGAGEVRHPSRAVLEGHDREFDLHYQDADKEMGDRIQISNDPRVIAKALHQDYDVTEAVKDYFLLNGKSFPYTMRESLVTVSANETVKLRVVNGGAEPISLHAHGHKPTITAYDGVDAQPGAQIQRDVFTLTAAQRLDLDLRTVDDGLNSYGPGAWFMHDHQEQAVTTNGIGPGGDISLIVYAGYQDQDMMPTTNGHGWEVYFTEEYYRGEIPTFGIMGIPGVQETAADDAPEEESPAWMAGFLVLLAIAWRRR